MFIELNERLLGSDFPPADIRDLWEEIEFYQALRDSDEARLRAEAQASNLGGHVEDPYIPHPVAALISQVSANLLFGEAPVIRTAATSDQDRLDEIRRRNQLDSKLRSAAVTSSSEGGVYMKTHISDYTPLGRRVPIFSFVSPGRVIPRFVGNELVGAHILTTWSKWNTAGLESDVYRLVESHDAIDHPGRVLTRLYRGTSTSWGKQVGLDSFSATKGLVPESDYGMDELLISYIPNRMNMSSVHGDSDYKGMEQMLLALNQRVAITQQMLQMSSPILFANRSLLDERGRLRGSGTVRVVPVDDLYGDYGAEATRDPISITQAEVKSEMLQFEDNLLDKILTQAGISPASLGRDTRAGGAQSGTARRLMVIHSLATIANKAGFFRDAITEQMRVAALLDTRSFGRKAAHAWSDPETMPTVQLRDGIPEDEETLARIVQTLAAAEVISQETAVRTFHRTWSDDDVKAEVQRLQTEAGNRELALNGLLGERAAEPFNSQLPPEAPAERVGEATGV